MTIHFEAEAVEVEVNENDVLCVGFYTEENYLMISYPLDIEDGNYHIERDDQSWGEYGGVEKINLSRNQIEVILDERGKKHLECGGVTVDFEADDETFEILVQKLRFIFKDSLVVN